MARGRSKYTPGPPPQDPAYRRHVAWLFCETLDDVRGRLGSNPPATRYQLLALSGLLRRLLLDRSPLVHQANRHHQFDVAVLVHPMRTDEQLPASPALPPGATLAGTFHGDFMDPAHGHEGPDWPVLTLGLDAWKRHIVARVGQQEVSMQEYVQHAANVEGGVHAGRPTTPLERAMMDATVGLAGGPSDSTVYHTLRGIGSVTNRGLTELYEGCRAEL